MNTNLNPTADVRDTPRTTDLTNRTRKKALRVLGYYVSPTKLYKQALADGIMGEDTEDINYWTTTGSSSKIVSVVKPVSNRADSL